MGIDILCGSQSRTDLRNATYSDDAFIRDDFRFVHGLNDPLIDVDWHHGTHVKT